MVKSFLLAALTVASVHAHGNLVSVRSNAGTAGPMGQAAFRDGIVRGDSGVPGPEQGYRCDWCVLENRPRQERLPACLDGGCPENGWWTETPAAHWDNPDNFPSIPCMSNDSYGQRGTLAAEAGETVSVDLYVNADHGGFYRYEFVNSTNPTNEEFMANPISPWYAFHAEAETAGSYPGRVVGYTKADTDGYIYDMNRVPGGGLGGDRKNPSSQDPNSSFCQSNFDNCFYRDSVQLPSGIEGEGVLRMNWFSAETSQIYTNCIDMAVGDGAPLPPGSPTSAPPSPTSAPPAPTPSPGGQCAEMWQQCGGIGHTGATDCCAGAGSCQVINDYYFQCL